MIKLKTYLLEHRTPSRLIHSLSFIDLPKVNEQLQAGPPQPGSHSQIPHCLKP